MSQLRHTLSRSPDSREDHGFQAYICAFLRMAMNSKVIFLNHDSIGSTFQSAIFFNILPHKTKIGGLTSVVSNSIFHVFPLEDNNERL